MSKSEFNVKTADFRWALWRAAGKGWRTGKITKEQRRKIRSFVRTPIRVTPIGDVDVMDALQGSVETKMMDDARIEGTPVRFDWFSLIAILLEMLPTLMEWIKDLLDRLDDDEE